MFDKEKWLKETKDRRKNQQSAYRKKHLKYYADYKKNYYKTHPEFVDYQRRRRKAFCTNTYIKILVLLGNKCWKCGYSGLALQIHHVHNNGGKERKHFGSADYRYYSKILSDVKNGSEDYQLLCANCNWEKRLEASVMYTSEGQ